MFKSTIGFNFIIPELNPRSMNEKITKRWNKPFNAQGHLSHCLIIIPNIFLFRSIMSLFLLAKCQNNEGNYLLQIQKCTYGSIGARLYNI